MRTAAVAAIPAPNVAPAVTTAKAAPAVSGAGSSDGKAAIVLTQQNACVACHAMDTKVLGPSFSAIAQKHAGKVDYLASKIKGGGSGVWGAIPMPAQTLTESDARIIAAWLAAGAGK